jgi:hypothetical protein
VLLNRLPDGVDVALILVPVLTPEELLVAVSAELGVTPAGSAARLPVLHDALWST